jgi:hypothetical protein
MPVLVTGIHVFLLASEEDVDGRVKPGHDEEGSIRSDRHFLFRHPGACSYLVYHPELMSTLS